MSTNGGRDAQPLWTRWRTALAEAERWRPPAGRVLVVAPHPDDEVLATGALLAGAHDAVLLAVTDGEAAYPQQVAPETLAERRRCEQDAAARALGVGSTRIERLGIPDGSVAAHEGRLAEAIAELAVGCSLVVAPWVHDHHSDHEACGRAAVAAVAALGPACRPMLVHSVFWGWQHQRPGVRRRWLRLAITPEHRHRRNAALLHHRSQLTAELVPQPILRAHDLEPLRWRSEYYLAAGAR